MTDVKLARILRPQAFPSATPTPSNQSVDTTTDGWCVVFLAEKAEAITHVGFRYGARTGTPPTYIVGLETTTVSTGVPTGTYRTNGGNCSATFTPPASTAWDGLWQWVALDNSYTPTVGEYMAIVVRYSSGTCDGSNFSSFTTVATNIEAIRQGIPYTIRLNAGTWAAKSSAQAIYGYRSASGRYGMMYQDYYTTRTASTVGLRIAAKLNLPTSYGSTYVVSSIRFIGSAASASGKNPLCKIWSASSALASCTLDSDYESNPGALIFCYDVPFPSPPTLTTGTDYYFGLEVADAVNGGVLINGITYAETDDMASIDGAACILSTWNGSAWSDNTLCRPWMEFVISDLTPPSASGAAVGSFLKSGSGRAATY